MLSKKMLAVLTGATLTLGLIFSSVMTNNVAALTTTERLYGNNRYETAYTISKSGWQSSKYAIVVRGDEFADALCAGPLSKIYNAPILLTQRTLLDENTKKRLKELETTNVLIVGGTGAVSEDVEKSITAMGIKVERFAGKDRYETSIQVAQKVGVSNGIVIATGSDFADALSVAPVATSQKMPIILTEKDSISTEIKKFINNNSALIPNSYIIGGTGVISKDVENSFKNPERISGIDRFSTNVEVLKKFQDELNLKHLYVAIGDGPTKMEFADALAGSALAAKTGSPIILVNDNLPKVTANYLSENIVENQTVIALGGDKVVSNSIISTISQMKINADIYDKKDGNYGSNDANKMMDINKNINLNGENATLRNTKVSGNIFISGNSSRLSNVIVDGTIFVDPGESGNIFLDNVTAKKVRVLSGAKNSIHLYNVTSKDLIVESDNSKDSVRIVSEGKTEITNTKVKSDTVLEAKSGSLGAVTINANNEELRSVQLSGNFEKEVISKAKGKIEILPETKVAKMTVNDKSTISLQNGAKVEKLTLNTNASLELKLGSTVSLLEIGEAFEGDTIQIIGQGTIISAQIKSINAKVNFDKNLNVQRIEAVNRNNIEGSDSLKARVEEKTQTQMSNPTSNVVPGGGSGGSGGSGADVVQVNKPLVNAISVAETLLNQAVEGTLVNQYAIGSKAAFKASIDALKVVRDKSYVTKEEINDALIKLSNATNLFNAKKVIHPSIQNFIDNIKKSGFVNANVSSIVYDSNNNKLTIVTTNNEKLSEQFNAECKAIVDGKLLPSQSIIQKLATNVLGHVVISNKMLTQVSALKDYVDANGIIKDVAIKALLMKVTDGNYFDYVIKDIQTKLNSNSFADNSVPVTLYGLNLKSLSKDGNVLYNLKDINKNTVESLFNGLYELIKGNYNTLNGNYAVTLTDETQFNVNISQDLSSTDPFKTEINTYMAKIKNSSYYNNYLSDLTYDEGLKNINMQIYANGDTLVKDEFNSDSKKIIDGHIVATESIMQKLIDTFLDNVNINDKNISQFNLFKDYVDSNNKLINSKIVNLIKSSPDDDYFKFVINKLKTKINDNSFADNAIKVKINNYSLVKLSKGDVVLFNSKDMKNNSVDSLFNNILNMINENTTISMLNGVYKVELEGNLSYTLTLSNIKVDLKASIELAKTKVATAVEGKDIGQYIPGTKTKIKEVIASSELVYKNIKSTPLEIKNQINTMNNAIKNFDINKVDEAIVQVKNDGLKVTVDVLAIDIDNSEYVTIVIVDSETNNEYINQKMLLEDHKTQFSTSLNYKLYTVRVKVGGKVYEQKLDLTNQGKSSLKLIIESANEKVTNASIGSGEGQYLSTTVEELKVSIKNANTIFDNNAATSQEIQNAIATLKSAISTFEGKIIVVDKAELINSIENANKAITNTVQGKIYIKIVTDNFKAEIAKAEAVNKNTLATAVEVADAKKALDTKKAEYDNAYLQAKWISAPGVVDKSTKDYAISGIKNVKFAYFAVIGGKDDQATYLEMNASGEFIINIDDIMLVNANDIMVKLCDENKKVVAIATFDDLKNASGKINFKLPN